MDVTRSLRPCAVLLLSSECFVFISSGYSTGTPRAEELLRFIPPFSAAPHFHILLVIPSPKLPRKMLVRIVLPWDASQLPKV